MLGGGGGGGRLGESFIHGEMTKLVFKRSSLHIWDDLFLRECGLFRMVLFEYGLPCICTIICEYGFSTMLLTDDGTCILVCYYCMTSVGDQLCVVTVLFLLKHYSYFTRSVSYRSKETEVQCCFTSRNY